MAPALFDGIASTILWSLLGHFSQQFDIQACLVYILADYSIQNPLVRALVLSPLLRFFGDMLFRILYTRKLYVPDQSETYSRNAPSLLWYAGEILGDSYLPIKASSFVSRKPKLQAIIWVLFSFLAGTKIANIIFRYYGMASNMEETQFELIKAYFDLGAVYTGILLDIACCIVMHYYSDQALTSKSRMLKQSIKTSSLVRFLIALFIKALAGVFLAFNPCLNNDPDTCDYSFLRSIVTTLDYQLYYFDWFLTKHFGKLDKERTENRLEYARKREEITGKKMHVHAALDPTKLMTTK